jgi:hypothetical protein
MEGDYPVACFEAFVGSNVASEEAMRSQSVVDAVVEGHVPSAVYQELDDASECWA